MSDGASWATRLERFYTKYNPDKLSDIQSTLEKFKGREETMFKALVRKYGPEPADDEVLAVPTQDSGEACSTTATISPIESSNPYFGRLFKFYEKYNPDKMDDVPGLLEKYEGKEPKLFKALVKKYGPEPFEDDSSDESEAGDNASDQDEEENLMHNGLRSVVYCPVDTLPPEYCEYGPMFDECKPWLLENCPDLYLQKYKRTVKELVEVEKQIADGVEGVSLEVNDGKKEKKMKRPKKKAEEKRKADPKVYLERIQRSKRKCLTFVFGLEDFEGINIKQAAKKLGKKFACSASVEKKDLGFQMQLQGDCIDDMPQVLVDLFSVPEDKIFIVEKGSKRPAF